jgi:hypothetical protein
MPWPLHTPPHSSRHLKALGADTEIQQQWLAFRYYAYLKFSYLPPSPAASLPLYTSPWRPGFCYLMSTSLACAIMHESLLNFQSQKLEHHKLNLSWCTQEELSSDTKRETCNFPKTLTFDFWTSSDKISQHSITPALEVCVWPVHPYSLRAFQQYQQHSQGDFKSQYN